MAAILSVLIVLGAGEPVVVKDTAAVAGRYVRLVDVVESGLLGDAIVARFEKVYLGRAPGEGKTRTIDVERIRRELQVRGIDPAAYEFVGGPVEVTRSGSTLLGAALRRAVAFEIKRHLLERKRVVRADDFSVRIVRMSEESFPVEVEVAEVRPRGPEDSEAPEFTVILERADGGTGHWEMDVTARVLPVRRMVVAAREIPRGKLLAHGDVRVVRRPAEDRDPFWAEPAAFVGGRAVVPIGKGTVLGPSKVRMKPLIRRGDLVRVVSPDYEVDAKAMEDGVRGEEIGLVFLGTRNRIQARIVGAGRARVEVTK